ncbi:MAG TPA: hypothetical protein VFS47_06695, partial [Steroidobacteraceae bacterium]|nr:hypothetical protein [Steroidobacteraceae bacterium]
GFLVKASSSAQQALFVLGGCVVATAVCALAVRFTGEQKREERRLYEEALNARAAAAGSLAVADAATP